VFTPPFVDRSFGIPPANIPPRPGARPASGGGGAELRASALPVLFALARVFGADAFLKPLGTGGAPPTGAGLLTLDFPKHQ
jgi:hypothetical protein